MSMTIRKVIGTGGGGGSLAHKSFSFGFHHFAQLFLEIFSLARIFSFFPTLPSFSNGPSLKNH